MITADTFNVKQLLELAVVKMDSDSINNNDPAMTDLWLWLI